MIPTISFKGERCPDGVELFDYGDRPAINVDGVELLDHDRLSAIIAKTAGMKTGHWFRYRSPAREAVSLTAANLEDPIVTRFINADDEAARVRFLSRYGLTQDEERSHEDILITQHFFRVRLASAGCGDPVVAGDVVNDAMARHRGFALVPSISGNSLVLRAQSLFAFMFMEVAIVALIGARLAACRHCGAALITGPLTGRRSHAKFCADRCRVAAMRARNAQNN
jgi:hypothetical protein